MPKYGRMARGRRGRIVRRRVNRRRSVYMKKKRKASFMYSGVSFKTEVGGELTSTTCAYLGHSTGPADNCMLVFWLACLRKVGKKLGQDFENPQDNMQNLQHTAAFTDSPGDYKIRYKAEADDAIATIAHTVTAGQSYISIAQSLNTLWNTTIGVAEQDPVIISFEFHARSQDGLGGGNFQIPIVLRMHDCKFRIKVVSKLRVQNVTEAGTGAAGTDDSVLDVRANPLVGKCYSANMAGLRRVYDRDFTAPTVNLNPNTSTGLITFDAADANLPAHSQNVFKKPPPAQAFVACKRSVPVTVQPGAISSNVIVSDMTTYPNKFLRKFMPFLQDAVKPNWFGKCKVVGLEHSIHSGVTEPDVKLHYNLDVSFYGVLTEKSMKFIPHVI